MDHVNVYRTETHLVFLNCLVPRSNKCRIIPNFLVCQRFRSILVFTHCICRVLELGYKFTFETAEKIVWLTAFAPSPKKSPQKKYFQQFFFCILITFNRIMAPDKKDKKRKGNFII